ncbi:MAG: AMP-binding protein, partial [Burkholderiales bacterium]
MAAILTLQDIEQAKRFYDKGYWRCDTLYSLMRSWAERFPERFALRDTNARLTYASTLEWVDAVAADLDAAGIRPGDRVSLWLPSRVEAAILILACSRMGYVCNTSLHRDYTCLDIVNLLKRARTAAFFGQPNYGGDADCNDIFRALENVDSLKKVYRLDPLVPEPSAVDLTARFGGITRPAADKLPWSTSPDQVMYLAFTSGTTAQPKGVMHTDNTLLANGRPIVKDWKFNQDTIVYSLSPMSHNIGMVALVVTIVCGGELVMHTPHDARRTLDRIVETRATYLLGVPTHAIDLVNEVKQRRLPSLGSVRAFQIGGSSVPASLVRDLQGLGVTVQNAFGMTENCSFQYTRPDDSIEVVANTCGRPCEGFELALWREDNPDELALPGESGEMGVRGACLMLGYFDDQASTEAAF